MWDIPAFEIGALVIWDMPACRDTFFSIHEACPVLGRVADEKKKGTLNIADQIWHKKVTQGGAFHASDITLS